MRTMRLKCNFLVLTVLITCLFFTQCKTKTNDFETDGYASDPSFADEREGYEDDTYCAEVDYYYSETGTNSTYTLLVDIENNELVKIQWPNGGWLDESHFSAPDIEDGDASFTSDAGVDYSVTIIGNEGDCSISFDAEDEDDLIREKEDRDQAQKDAEEEEEERMQQEEDEKKQQEQEEESEHEERDQEDDNN